jgi:hypothetical protein
MLRGMALDQYFALKLSELSFEEATRNIKGYFEGANHTRKALDEWNSITLKSTIKAHPEKSIQDALMHMISQLRLLHHSLDPEIGTAKFMHNKLVTACEGVSACRYAVADPPDGVGALINKLQTSILAYQKENETQESFFTDRRYYNRPQNKPESRRPQYSQQRPRNRSCYICRKPDCRSYKHTKAEQEEHRAKFKSTYRMGKFPNDRFNQRYRQFVSEWEEADSEEELEAAFQSVAIDNDIDSDENDSHPFWNGTIAMDATQFHTSIGDISAQEAQGTTAQLADLAFNHALGTTTTPAEELPQGDITAQLLTAVGRYSANQFMGIIIDTGAARYSTAGHGQMQALQKLVPSTELDSSTKGAVKIQFGIGATSSIGTVVVATPVGNISFHVVQENTPFLLSLADMDQLQLRFDNLRNLLISPTKSVPVVRRFGHAFLLWNTSLTSLISESFSLNPCYLTSAELARLHRRFGHPSVQRLSALLERSGHSIEKDALEHLSKYCQYCQKHSRSPGRFRFTLRDDVTFNYNVVVDILYIEGKATLHIVDEATRFQAGRFLKDISAKHTWEALRVCWIDTYLGPPDLITHDAGKNFVSKEFKQYAGNLGITVKPVPVEAHNSIGIVERYHGPLRRAYQIIVAEIPGIEPEFALQMAFKAINDSAGPNGLVPTLLVFGAYPRMTEMDAPSPTVTQRSVALKKAMEELRKLRAQRQVREALNTRNGPNTSAVQNLEINSEVLVWREGNGGQTGTWEGPFRLIDVTGETVTVDLPHGPTQFRSTVIKPYYVEQSDEEEIPQEAEPPALTSPPGEAPSPTATTAPEIQPTVPAAPAKRGRGRPRKHPVAVNAANVTVYLQDQFPSGPETQSGRFTASRQKEVTGLLEKGVFKLVNRNDVPEGTRIFNSRFVDQVKFKGTDQAYEKSRIVVQAYNDQGKEQVLTQSPTIQRTSQRLMICLAAMLRDEETELYLRDITQAYTQSKSKLNRVFYIHPPPELTAQLGMNNDVILQVVKPLYGVPESGNHWFKTYHGHHTEQLGMTQSTYDPCFLYRNSLSTKEPRSFVGLQTDDTLILGNTLFADLEEQKLKSEGLISKDRESLAQDRPIKFNGGLIELLPTGDLLLTQEAQCKNLSLVGTGTSSTTSARGITRKDLSMRKQYIAQRARGAYIASISQPEAAFDLSFAAQVTEPMEDDAKALNKRIQWQIDNSTRGLKFVKLDPKSLQLVVFTDSSFANNTDLTSQIGYVITLADATGKANIVHWSSIKCKRVTRSVLASELYAMTHGFDIAAAIKSTIDRALLMTLPMVMCTDSKSLYDCLVRLGTTQEKRLMIDILCLRQSYERREIAELKWIDGNTNPADAMTKSAKACPALTQLVDSNRIDIKAMGWVERTGDIELGGGAN